MHQKLRYPPTFVRLKLSETLRFSTHPQSVQLQDMNQYYFIILTHLPIVIALQKDNLSISFSSVWILCVETS